jgi:hypothetical protein
LLQGKRAVIFITRGGRYPVDQESQRCNCGNSSDSLVSKTWSSSMPKD